MSGNTKLMGFNSSIAVLERWGVQARVELPIDSIERLRKACYEDLPKAPKDPSRAGLATFKFEFERGIEGRLDLDKAEKLLSILSGSAKDITVLTWMNELEEAIGDMRSYLDTRDEPGIDQP